MAVQYKPKEPVAVATALYRPATGDGRYWNIRHTQLIWVRAIMISSPKWKNHCDGHITIYIFYF
jgi:hypothetical protein